jgi:hypothetical protein
VLAISHLAVGRLDSSTDPLLSLKAKNPNSPISRNPVDLETPVAAACRTRRRRRHGEGVPRAACGLHPLHADAPPSPSPGCGGLPSACLRAAPPLHLLCRQPAPLHVLRRQRRRGLLCAAPLRGAHRHRLRHIIRGRAAAPGGAGHQHAPDLAEDDLHPPPAPIRRPRPPRRRRPVRPVPLPPIVWTFPTARREVPLRDRARLGHRRFPLPLLRLLHALGRSPWGTRPLQMRQPSRLLHAPHGHLLRGLSLPAAGWRAHVRNGDVFCAMVYQGLQQAACRGCIQW